MRNTHGYIPKNMGGGTIWDGRLKIRNTVEAVTIAFVVYFLTTPLASFLPELVITIIRMVVGGIFGLLALRGIGGEPLSIWFLNVINYSNTRTYATLQPPQRELEMPEKKKRQKGKPQAAENKQKKTKAEKKLAKLEKKEAKRKQKEAIKEAKAAKKKGKTKGEER